MAMPKDLEKTLKAREERAKKMRGKLNPLKEQKKKIQAEIKVLRQKISKKKKPWFGPSFEERLRNKEAQLQAIEKQIDNLEHVCF